jgi:hypothetical protein
MSGLRIIAHLAPLVVDVGHTEVVVLVLPTGLAVPTVNTVATLKANERFIWLRGSTELLVPPSATVGIEVFEANPATKRRYEINDRLVMVLINRSNAVWGAGSAITGVVDVYANQD